MRSSLRRSLFLAAALPALASLGCNGSGSTGTAVSASVPLEALGMNDAFDPKRASFTPMIGAGGVYIADVLHQAFVDVDESGTEAAAATAVIGVGLAANTNPVVDVVANRAFFFFIRDQATNSVLFVGREADPTAD